MRLMQSFLMFFYILDKCYDQCKEDDLGGFLGSISPELWEDGRPIDKAVYNDWETKNEISSLNLLNIVNATAKFIEYYEVEFGYCFSKTRELLRGNISREVILKAQEQTVKMYQKYNYLD